MIYLLVGLIILLDILLACYFYVEYYLIKLFGESVEDVRNN